MTERLFQNVIVDPARQARLFRRPAAKRMCVIYFTPRSGSSWLTSILAATGQLGAGNEALNPDFIPDIAQAIDAPDMDSYIQMLLRQFNMGDVFSVEVTAHQIISVFENYEAFHQYFGLATCFWLIREDIVSQAVSLAKMIATKIAHSEGTDESTRLLSESLFTYDSESIKNWILHIRAAEMDSEAWFQDYGLEPLRMSYEQTTRMPPLKMVNVFARHLGLPDIAPMEFPVTHTKLATPQNRMFADRFRTEETRFTARIDADRAPMLSRLHRIEDIVADL
jgi:trehalose 2-sulfotransferase